MSYKWNTPGRFCTTFTPGASCSSLTNMSISLCPFTISIICTFVAASFSRTPSELGKLAGVDFQFSGMWGCGSHRRSGGKRPSVCWNLEIRMRIGVTIATGGVYLRLSPLFQSPIQQNKTRFLASDLDHTHQTTRTITTKIFSTHRSSDFVLSACCEWQL